MNLNSPNWLKIKKKKLENSLSVEELLEAVQCMNSGKAPGPDGIPVEIL